MPTVIDALTISLGLDPKAFVKGTKDATASLGKTKEETVKSGKAIEKSLDGASDAVDRLARNALKLFALFTAGRAIKDFAADITSADSALGRLAARVGSTPEAISGLANAVARNGGSADAAANSFQRFSDAVNELKTTGSSSIMAPLAKMQALSGQTIRLNADAITRFGDLADAAKGTADKAGAPMANFLLRQAGIDQDTAALLIQGRAKLMAELAKSGKLGLVRKEDAEAAQKLQTSIETLRQTSENFGRTIMTKVTPVIVDLIERFQRWIEANKEWIQSDIVAKLEQFARALREIPWDDVGEGIRDFARDANAAAQAVGGWTKVVEGLFALWLGSKFLNVLKAIGLLRVALTGGKLTGGLISALGLLGTAEIAALLGTSVATDKGTSNAEKPGVITRSDDENTGAAVPPSKGYSDGGIGHDRGVVREYARRAWRGVKRMFGGGEADAAEGGAGIRARARRAGYGGPNDGDYTGNDGRRAAHGRMTEEGRKNVASWMEFFRKPADKGGMGYTEEQARGQIAMMQGESGLNLDPAAKGDKDSRGVPHAFGTVQWSDANGNQRFPDLKKLATEMGRDWTDRSVQQEMYRREMMGAYRPVYDRIRASERGEQSLRHGIEGYENPRDHALAFQIRAPFLNRLRQDAAGGKPVAGNVPPVNGVGGLDQNQGGATRGQPITAELQRQIVAAATASGVNAEVYSGGQEETGPNRTGSHRHDHGNAADLKLYRMEDGKKRYLSMLNDADRAVMEKFIRTSVAAGANGVGAAPDYMGPNGIHVGGGSPAAWGAGGATANAPDWVSRAHRQGMDDRAAGTAAESLKAADRAIKAATAPKPVAAPPAPAAPAAQAAPAAPAAPPAPAAKAAPAAEPPKPTAWRGIPAAYAFADQVRAAQAAQISRISNDNRTTTSNDNSSETHFHGDFNIQTAATDGPGLMADLRQSLSRRTLAMSVNNGQA